jgi:hypothetical protein
MRILVSIRRLVEVTRRGEYDAAWDQLAASAGRMPFRVNAWRFRAAADPRLHVEFLEYSGDIDPREDAAISAALRTLEGIGVSEAEEWLDVPYTDSKDLPAHE